jgi:hypothetical protein
MMGWVTALLSLVSGFFFEVHGWKGFLVSVCYFWRRKAHEKNVHQPRSIMTTTTATNCHLVLTSTIGLEMAREMFFFAH